MWQPMETCPEGRPVFVKIDAEDDENQVAIRIRRGTDIFCDDGTFAGKAKFYIGWLPCLFWQTGKAPRDQGWLLVTWDDGERVKLRWSGASGWVNAEGITYQETWLAWTWDLPDFVPLPKPAEPASDLAGKSVDEIVAEIKRLTDHLATVVKSE